MQKIALFAVVALLLVPAGAFAQSDLVSILDFRVNLQDGQQAETGRPVSLQLNLRANEPVSLVYIF